MTETEKPRKSIKYSCTKCTAQFRLYESEFAFCKECGSSELRIRREGGREI